MTTPRRAEVWNVRFDPSEGAEIQKIRPAVVLNVPDIGRLPLCIVVPITHWQDRYAPLPWLIRIEPAPANGLAQPSCADAFQVKSVSVTRFLRKLGALTDPQVSEIAEAVAMCIGS